MSITLLPPRHWHQLEGIFNDEFDSDLPDAQGDAEIFMSTDGGKRTGFILAEQVTLIGQIYVYPEFREKNVARNARDLVKFMQDRYQGKMPVGAVASEARFGKLYRLLGMQKIDGDFYRKN